MRTIKRTRSKTAVHFFLEGGFLVRGTLDPHTALALAVDDGDPYQLGWACGEAVRPEKDGDLQPVETEVGALNDLMHVYLNRSLPGLYRVIPSPPGDDEYSWYFHPANKRGPGVFEGVMFL